MKGFVHQRDEKRDKALIEDYISGLSSAKLSGKYGISQSRIYQVLNHYKIKKRSYDGRHVVKKSRKGRRKIGG
jgi:Mor family transcriptional regulator